jgi:putative tryptophan/tyrosine transport system substrate-binding protein
MRWRNLVALVLAAAVWPLVLHAQASNQSRRIGVLMGLPESDPQGKRYLSAFTAGLHDLGWVEGSNLRIDYRAGGATWIERGCSPRS